MPSLLIQAILLTASGGLVLLLRFLGIPFPVIAQLLLLAILLIALIFNRTFLSANLKHLAFVKWGVAWGCAFLVQLAVATTGGLYSPLLILILLFFIAASFLLSLTTSILFIMVAGSTLVISLAIDPLAFQLFRDDPAVGLLYLAAFVAVIPLAQLISRQYAQKDTSVKTYSHQVVQDQTILEKVNDILLITNTSLQILSANKAAETVLKRSTAELIKKPLLDVLFLRNIQGMITSPEMLAIQAVLSSKQPMTIPDLSLMTANTTKPKIVSLQILPMVNLDGVIESITFILSDQRIEESQHEEVSEPVEFAVIKYQALTEQLKQSLAAANMPQQEAILEMTSRMSEDVRLSLTLNHIVLEQNITPVDVAQLCADVVAVQQHYGRLLGITVRWVAPTDGVVATNVALPSQIQALASSVLSTGPVYTAPIDPQWVAVLLQKLLTMSMMATVGQTNRSVVTNIIRHEKELEIRFTTGVTSLTATEQLFQANPNKHGSGLEALLSKQLAEKLSIPLQIEVVQQQVVCSLRILQGH